MWRMGKGSAGVFAGCAACDCPVRGRTLGGWRGIETDASLQRLSRIGVVIGDGQQSFPWISVHDLCRSFDFMIQNSTLRGVVNLVSPQCITQKQLAYALARADGIRWVMPLPTFIFRLMFGEGASFVTEGQTVHPTKLLESGFTYDYPTIEKLMNITDHRTVQALDVRRYMGRWYEIARYENHSRKV